MEHTSQYLKISDPLVMSSQHIKRKILVLSFFLKKYIYKSETPRAISVFQGFIIIIMWLVILKYSRLAQWLLGFAKANMLTPTRYLAENLLVSCWFVGQTVCSPAKELTVPRLDLLRNRSWPWMDSEDKLKRRRRGKTS